MPFDKSQSFGKYSEAFSKLYLIFGSSDAILVSCQLLLYKGPLGLNGQSSSW
jgi:hypothetical protein